MTEDECKEKLAQYARTIQHLEEENRELRRAADSFGQLAERLNEALNRERRHVDDDRRRESRPGSDRRSQPQDR